MGLASADNDARTILENLCNLEINTIIKRTITGRKMPAPEIALVGLAETYSKKLASLGAPAPDKITGGPVQYRELHTRSIKLIEAMTIESDEYGIIVRIRNTALEILCIFRAVRDRTGADVRDDSQEEAFDHPIELRANEIIVLRKAYDLGLEEIALQTIVQLDGDVVHRVQPRYAKEEFRELLANHMEAVQVSVSYWGTLIDIIGTLMGSVVRLLGLRP